MNVSFLHPGRRIKFFSPEGPVLFIQTRVGYNRWNLQMLKFRTILPDAERLQPQLEAMNEATRPLFKIKDDPRVTPNFSSCDQRSV